MGPPRAQSNKGCISLKLAVETRLKSESFEPLIGFLAFLVQKLWKTNIFGWKLPMFLKNSVV